MPGPRFLGRPSCSLLTAYRSLLTFFGDDPNAWSIFGVDWGEVRIGLALSDETQTLASPLETLMRRRGKRFPMPRLLELMSHHGAVGVVVGLPLSARGRRGSRAPRAPATWPKRSHDAPACPWSCGTNG